MRITTHPDQPAPPLDDGSVVHPAAAASESGRSDPDPPEANRDLSIRHARRRDAAAVYGLAQENLLRHVGSGAGRGRGFLVGEHSEAFYAAAADWAQHFLVGERSGHLLGFVLAYLASDSEVESIVGRGEHNALKPPFVFIDQVCVRTGATSRGVGSLLYRGVSQQSGEHPVVATVFLEPENTRGIAFHRKNGFSMVSEATPRPGCRKGVWVQLPGRDLEGQAGRGS